MSRSVNHRRVNLTAMFALAATIAGAIGGCAATSNPTTLPDAIRADNTPAMVQFLNAGADINQRDSEGYTPLHWAAYYGRVDAAQLLLDRGANPEIGDNSGRTALEVAIYYRHPNVAQHLVEKGANVNARDQDGWTPLDYAAYNRDLASTAL